MATFPVDVTVNPRPAEAGLRRVQSALGRTESAAERVGRTLLRAFSGIALGLGGAGVIRVLSNYERQMAQVIAVTRGAEQSFQSLRTESQRLGATTEFSASRVATAMGFLGRAGFTANQVLIATEQTLTLATAGALDLARAADIASNVLSGFGLEVEQLGRVNDVLAATATSTNTTVGGLGQSLSFVAPIARTLGVELETVSAALGVLGNSGIQGTRAATGLRTVMASLLTVSSEGDMVLQELGLTLDDINPQMVGLTGAFDALNEAGIDTEQIFRLVGREGASAFAALLAGTGTLRELEVELRNSSGAAERLATIIRDQLGGSIDSLVSRVEGLIIALGEQGVTRVARAAIDTITQGIDFLIEQADKLIIVLEAMVFIIGTAMVFAVARLSAALVALVQRNPLVALFSLAASATVLAINLIIEYRNEIRRALYDAAFAVADFVDTTRLGFIGFSAALGAVVDNAINAVLRNAAEAFNALISLYNDVQSGPLGSVIPGGTTELVDITPFEAVDVGDAFRAAQEAASPTSAREWLQDRLGFPPLETVRLETDKYVKVVADALKEEIEAVNAVREDPAFRTLLDQLEQQGELLMLTTEAREREVEVLRFQGELERDLLPVERELVENQVDLNRALAIRHGILDQLRDPTTEALEQIRELNFIINGGVEGLMLTNEELDILRMRLQELREEVGDADFLSMLHSRLNEAFGATDDLFLSIAEKIPDLVERMSAGIARSITGLITGTESFGDAIRNVAASAIQFLIQQLIQAVVQALILKAIFLVLGIGPGGGSFGSLVTSALTGSRGGLVGNLPLQHLQAGGIVVGPGGQTEDRVLAALSPQEFVVNARAASANRQELEDINAGRRRRTVNNYNVSIVTPDADSFGASRRQIQRDFTDLARKQERRDR